MVNLLVATFEGNHTKSPPTEPFRTHSPGAKNLTQRPSIEQTAGVAEVITGSIVKPKVGVFVDAMKYAVQLFPPVLDHSFIE